MVMFYVCDIHTEIMPGTNEGIIGTEGSANG
jgi:hypothetical protein